MRLTKTLSITFNQRVSDTSFKVELKSYLTTEAEPLIKIKTPGKIKKPTRLIYMNKWNQFNITNEPERRG